MGYGPANQHADTLADLSKYTSVPRDGGVVAWPISYERPPRMQDKRELTFTIRAQVLRTKGSAGVWDEKEKEKEDEGASEKVVKVEAAEQTEKSSDANSASKTKTSSEDSATTKPEVEKDEL